MRTDWLFSSLFAAFWIGAAVWWLAGAGARADVRWANGRASWYGEGYRGKKMANGRPFDPEAMTCATWDFPFGTLLRVTNPRTGRSVIVEVTDRGPALWTKCTIDLSARAFRRIEDPARGKCDVHVSRVGEVVNEKGGRE